MKICNLVVFLIFQNLIKNVITPSLIDIDKCKDIRNLVLRISSNHNSIKIALKIKLWIIKEHYFKFHS
jgi:hypothetical protein